MRQKAGRRPANISVSRVEELAGKGLTLEEISSLLGIHQATLYRHKANNCELSEAIKKGQAKGIETVANALFESAIKGNVVAQIFYLKTRAKWKEASDFDKRELEPSEDDLREKLRRKIDSVFNLKSALPEQ